MGGEDRFHGAYSAVAALTLLPTIFLYARYGKGKGAVLWTGTGTGKKVVSTVFKGMGALSFAAAITNPSLTGMDPNAGKAAGKEMDMEPRGFNRITRHGTFMAFAFLGVGNVIARGFLGDVVFWSGFPIFWVIGSLHQDMRKKLTLPESFFDKTSLLPFKAILEGRNSGSKALEEMDKKALAIAVAAPLFLL
ncbi:hypothetical protein BJ684DRAFT_21448 [Piptocephalis cylindrospora]|uniref:NnrU domain-containing protein n=1 Tax=Piptocephalis cylindrospora TaxID=1907219 RepID=A0A4P9XZQ2_9FUNG|nr:hypothetical protein BJ684DRAFT_21448 [Piptocephalis cylindrospora]|eukprot:RKP11978.1 hypothetical protein BJ684DRAFT_21448 [Piptocephalis cylindrospora]